jgi:hypothetical protein
VAIERRHDDALAGVEQRERDDGVQGEEQAEAKAIAMAREEPRDSARDVT